MGLSSSIFKRLSSSSKSISPGSGEKLPYSSSNIDFYELSTRLGSDGLTLRQLRDDADTRRLRKYRRRLKELKKEEKTYVQILHTSLNRELLERKLADIEKHIYDVTNSIYTLECKRKK